MVAWFTNLKSPDANSVLQLMSFAVDTHVRKAHADRLPTYDVIALEQLHVLLIC